MTGHVGSYPHEYATVKYNGSGSLLWTARYSDGDCSPAAIAADPAGSVYVTGTSVTSAEEDFVTIKYDPAGNQQWIASYDGPNLGPDYARSIAVDSRGTVYVAGTSAEQFDLYPDYVLIAYDPNGMEKSIARYDSGYDDWLNAMALGSDGSVYVTGGSGGSSSPFDDAPPPDFFTLKFGATSPQPRPAPPTNLVASTSSAAEVILVWQNSGTDRTSIAIERKSSSAAQFAVIASVNGSVASYRDTTVAAGNEYTYRVRAFNGDVSSDYSNEASAKLPSGVNINQVVLDDPEFFISPDNGTTSLATSLYLRGSGAGKLSGRISLDQSRSYPFEAAVDFTRGDWVFVQVPFISWYDLTGVHTIKASISVPASPITSTIDVALSSFHPVTHGWPFANLSIDRFVTPSGSCVGMSYMAWDYFEKRQALPREMDPTVKTRKQIKTYHAKGQAWMSTLGKLRLKAYGLGSNGESRAVDGESAKIADKIRGGNPSVVALLATRDFDATEGHCVVATAVFSYVDHQSADQSSEGRRRFALYDPNSPGGFEYMDVVKQNGMFSTAYRVPGTSLVVHYPICFR